MVICKAAKSSFVCKAAFIWSLPKKRALDAFTSSLLKPRNGSGGGVGGGVEEGGLFVGGQFEDFEDIAILLG